MQFIKNVFRKLFPRRRSAKGLSIEKPAIDSHLEVYLARIVASGKARYITRGLDRVYMAPKRFHDLPPAHDK